VSKADVVAAILVAGATLYAIFGGADFGAGVWELLAARTRDRRLREGRPTTSG
jgi:cytochrome d ubiquinol oxidase subunit II